MEPTTLAESYLILFGISFLASTIIPLGSEWLLAAMVASGSSIPFAVTVASSGNYLGAVTTYLIGLYGGVFLIRRILKINTEKEEKAKRVYERYGTWTLLFSWLPVLGDAFCLVGGMMKTGFLRFSLLVFTGKLARYSLVAWLAKEGAGLMN
jgi:membrane protein YqaA with SNARE-associated domain